MTSTLLEAQHVVRHFTGGDGRSVPVLNGVNFLACAGEFIAIMGASGSGKSTLLNLFGALDTPNAGSIHLEGQDYAKLTPVALADLRNQRIGFIFQFHHLLRDFTARENVMMPLLIRGISPQEASNRALTLLATVGLADRVDFRATVLSGGEQQRVALARALVTDPVLLLADEPTGNLDATAADQMHHLLAAQTKARGVTLIAVTHNPALAGQADRILSLDASGLHPTTLEAMPHAV